MNHHHRKTLHAIFAHPIAANLAIADVEHVLESLGAEIAGKTGARIGVTLNGRSAAFHRAGHSLPKEEVLQLRKFLEACGVALEDYPL